MFNRKKNYIKAEFINGMIYVTSKFDDELSLQNTLNVINILKDDQVIITSLEKSIKPGLKLDNIRKILFPEPEPEQVQIKRFRTPAIQPEDVAKAFVHSIKCD